MEKSNTKDISELKNIKMGWIALREMDGYQDKDLIHSLCVISNEVTKWTITIKKNGLIVNGPVAWRDLNFGKISI